MDAAPRFPVEPDPMARLMGLVKNLQKDVESLQRGAPLRNASISGGEGLSVYDDDGVRRTILRGADGALVILGPDGEAVARFGPLLSEPGSFGGEIYKPSTGEWLKLLKDGAIDWATISNKPASFTPATHTHAGTDITTAVAEAAHAADADGSVRAYNNEPGGTGTNYQVWIDANKKLCRNTSSIRYKMNVRSHGIDPAKVLQLRPVLYDRKPRYNQDTEAVEEGNKDEYGLIAEEVAKLVPELAVYFNGQIDGVRYDLLVLPLLDVAKAQAAQLEEQAKDIAAMKAALKTLGATV